MSWSNFSDGWHSKELDWQKYSDVFIVGARDNIWVRIVSGQLAGADFGNMDGPSSYSVMGEPEERDWIRSMETRLNCTLEDIFKNYTNWANEFELE